MLSRTADSFFWIGRYMERAEYSARYLDVHYHLLLGSEEADSQADLWRKYLETTGELETYQNLHDPIRTSSVVEFLTLNKFNPNSIVQLIAAARDNARGIQDQLSSEVWHQINTFHLNLRVTTPDSFWQAPHEWLFGVQHTCYTLYGVLASTMMHDEGWCFYRLGQNIERAGHTTRLLAHPILLKGTSEPSVLSEFYLCLAILKSASAYEAYRKVYRSDLVPLRIAAFLLLNERFPRAVHCCTGTVRQLLSRLTTNTSSLNTKEPVRLAGQLAADLEYATIEEVYRTGLAPFLSDITESLDQISDAITQTFFHAGDPLDVTLPQPRVRRKVVSHCHGPVLRSVKAVLAVQNQFSYFYEAPVSSVRTMMRLAPAQHYGKQRRLDVRWHLEPSADYRHYTDAFGNLVWQFDHAQVEKTINCLVELRVETTGTYATDGVLAFQGVGLQDADCTVDPLEFTRLTHLVDGSDALARLAHQLRERGSSPVELADAILNQVHAHMRYEPGRTHVGTPASDAFGIATGVCQDYAHVMLALCRLAGLPARYVSGYLPGEGRMHAWVEVLLPIGEPSTPVWVAYDATHQRRCDEHYVTVAIGRDYQDIAPTSGYYSGEATNTFNGKVSVVVESQGPAEQWVSLPAQALGSLPLPEGAQQQ